MKRTRIRKVENITAIIDTREQCPLDLDAYGIETITDTIPYGDYTLIYPDMRDLLAIERKSLPDFVACCGRERDRFERELTALRGFQYRYIVGEFGLRDVLSHEYRSKINPDSVLGSIAKWTSVYGIHFLFCDHPRGAAYIVAGIMRFLAREVVEMARNRVLVPPWEAEKTYSQSTL